jgi:hemerythrin
MAQFLEWSPDLSMGVEIIDDQHKRLVDYVNQLDEARIRRDRGAIAKVIGELVDYTVSHFAFEEVMMEEAGYRFLKAHKRVHATFIEHVGVFQQRFKSGEDVELVATDMQATLVKWLMKHIKCEDMDYSETVRATLKEESLKPAEGAGAGWMHAALKRIFRGKQ